MKKIILSSILFILTACSTTSSYIPVKSAEAKPAECSLEVFMPGQVIYKKFEVLGAFEAEESGFSVNCDWKDTLAKNKQHACAQGADAVQFLSVNTPSSRSTCYTSKANFIKFIK